MLQDLNLNSFHVHLQVTADAHIDLIFVWLHNFEKAININWI